MILVCHYHQVTIAQGFGVRILLQKEDKKNTQEFDDSRAASRGGEKSKNGSDLNVTSHRMLLILPVVEML